MLKTSFYSGTSLLPNVTVTTANGTDACVQYITPASDNTSCTDFAIQNSIPVTSLIGLNDLNCARLGSSPYCAPASCQIAVSSQWQTYVTFLQEYSNITLTQLSLWNPFLNMMWINEGEPVCVAPPGGSFVPTIASQAVPSVFTTTATPSEPTPSGTISNCGLYYTVQSGDYCNALALKFSITFSVLIALNPSINSACTNLLLGLDYCVAPVNGTFVATPSTTLAPSLSANTASTFSISSSTSSQSSTVTTATTTATPIFPAAPGPTTADTTSQCSNWHVVESGDYCYALEQTYSISFAQFETWNPAVDSACDNLWVGYAYCVQGPPT